MGQGRARSGQIMTSSGQSSSGAFGLRFRGSHIFRLTSGVVTSLRYGRTSRQPGLCTFLLLLFILAVHSFLSACPAGDLVTSRCMSKPFVQIVLGFKLVKTTISKT